MPATTVNQMADTIGAKLQDPDPENDRYRTWATKLRSDPQYKNGIDAKTFVNLAQKQFGWDYKISDLDTWKPKNAGATPPAVSDEQVKADAKKIEGNVGNALTTPLLNHVGASKGVDWVKQQARGWGQLDPSKKEHSFGELGISVGQVTTGVMSGLAEAGISLSSPSNLAMMVAGFGLDKVKKFGKLIPIVKAIAAGGLTAEMIKDLASEIPEAKDALQKGDAVGFGNAVGRGLADAILGVKAGKELATGGKAAIKGEAKPKVEAAPKTEASKAVPPPEVRADVPPDIATVPPDKLQDAYTTAQQRTHEMRPRIERADTGLKEAREKLKGYKDTKEELEFKSTPQPKAVEQISKQIKAQEAHLEQLEERHRELTREYTTWKDALAQAHDRAVRERAPWYHGGGPPPVPQESGPMRAGGALIKRPPQAVTAREQPPPARPFQQPGQPQARVGAGQEPAAAISPGAAVATQQPPVAPPPQARSPYQQPGQPQAGLPTGQEPAQLPPSTQPFEMRGEQPPMPQSRQIEAGAPGARPRGAGEPVAMQPPLEMPGTTPPAPHVPAATTEPAFHGTGRGTPPPAVRGETKAKAAAPKKLTAGTSYTVSSAAHGLKAGDQVVYKGTGTNTGARIFDVIDAKTGKKSMIRIKGEVPLKKILGALQEGEEARRPGDKHQGDSPPPEQSYIDEFKASLPQVNDPGFVRHAPAALPDPGFTIHELPKQKRGELPRNTPAKPEDTPHSLPRENYTPHEVKPSLLSNVVGTLQDAEGNFYNKIQEGASWIGDKISGEKPDATVAYSRNTHQPIIYAHSREQMDELAGKDWGATFQKPGDVGWGGGPLANTVRELLPSGPVSVIGPDAVSRWQAPKQGEMQGTQTHEEIHQILGDTHVSPEKFLAALPPDIAENLRAKLTNSFAKRKWAEEIPAHLGASGVIAPGSDPRINQAETIGLKPEQAQKAWQIYLTMLEKQDPKKAAKLRKHFNPSPPEPR